MWRVEDNIKTNLMKIIRKMWIILIRLKIYISSELLLSAETSGSIKEGAFIV
jgi:hypothetical protein